jgi:hypothetical protein
MSDQGNDFYEKETCMWTFPSDPERKCNKPIDPNDIHFCNIHKRCPGAEKIRKIIKEDYY